MKYRSAALTLLAIQLVLVLSVAGKYWCERRNCPRVWVKTAQYDPSTPLRGRYLGLQLMVDACQLPRDKAQFYPGFKYAGGQQTSGYWMWDVRCMRKMDIWCRSCKIGEERRKAWSG